MAQFWFSILYNKKTETMKKIILTVWMAIALFIVSATLTPIHAQKKWSKKAKGAAIGAGAGAATGALISHKKGKRALIGGVVGGAGGYLYGKHRAKKTGTY
jgi:hypothetical protein